MTVIPHVIPTIEPGSDLVIRNYSDIFPNKQVPIPVLNDNRDRNVNHSDKLPPAFVQAPLGSCVAASVSAVKEYQEFLETSRIETITGPDGKRIFQVVKKSVHYLYDQRIEETYWELYQSVPETSTRQTVVVKGKSVTADVVEICLKTSNIKGLSLFRLITEGRDLLAFGGECFEVVDDSAEYYFSRKSEPGWDLSSNDDISIQSIDNLQMHDSMKSYFTNRGPKWFKSGSSGLRVIRENAIEGSLNTQYNSGQIVSFTEQHVPTCCDETSHHWARLELEFTGPASLLSFRIGEDKVPRINSHNMHNIRYLSSMARFEYMKIKVVRKSGNPKKHIKGTKINRFNSGWWIEAAINKTGDSGIVDEIFWPYRRQKFWDYAVKSIPREILAIGKDQSTKKIGNEEEDSNVFYKNSLNISTVEEMIHAVENHGPCPISMRVRQYKINNPGYEDHEKSVFDHMEFWKTSTNPKHELDSESSHAVVVVGFDYSVKTNGELEGHFLIRNSWGDSKNQPYKIPNGPIGTALKSVFGDLPGHTMIHFNEWSSQIKGAFVCKDGINNLKPTPAAGQLEFYYEILRNYCQKYDALLPEIGAMTSNEVFLLAIRGWHHDQPHPELLNKYSDTIVVLYNGDFWGLNNINTFIASTRPGDNSPSSMKGNPHLVNGVYKYNFDSFSSPEKLVPASSVEVQYDDGSEDSYLNPKINHKGINIKVGGVENDVNKDSFGEQIIFNSKTAIYDGNNETKPFDFFMQLITTKHTKKKTIPIAEALKLSIISEEEKKGFIDDNVESVDVPADIIYALIDSDQLIQYVENSQNGGGN
ncbi:MAG: hypothetical protein OR994_01420 [Candidatus Poseidoniales archaeon]|nr:hypothetical protein [Candidatus Poseidoniales archaeon]